MTRHLTAREGVSYGTTLREIADRARRVLRGSAEGLAECDHHQEILAVLQRIAEFREQLPPDRPTELRRWLEQVERRMEDFRETISRRAHSSVQSIPRPHTAVRPAD